MLASLIVPSKQEGFTRFSQRVRYHVHWKLKGIKYRGNCCRLACPSNRVAWCRCYCYPLGSWRLWYSRTGWSCRNQWSTGRWNCRLCIRRRYRVPPLSLKRGRIPLVYRGRSRICERYPGCTVFRRSPCPPACNTDCFPLGSTIYNGPPAILKQEERTEIVTSRTIRMSVKFFAAQAAFYI